MSTKTPAEFAEHWLGVARGQMKNRSAIPAAGRFAFIVACLYFAIPAPARAQQAPDPPTNQDELNKQLLQRVQELENEVNQLKAPSTSRM